MYVLPTGQGLGNRLLDAAFSRRMEGGESICPTETEIDDVRPVTWMVAARLCHLRNKFELCIDYFAGGPGEVGGCISCLGSGRGMSNSDTSLCGSGRMNPRLGRRPL